MVSVQLQLAFSIQKQNGIQWITIQYNTNFIVNSLPMGAFQRQVLIVQVIKKKKKKKKVSQIDYQ